MKHLVTYLSDDKIINKIYLFRGKKVMMDIDLADLYQVETGQLKRQVRRNIERFPDDFMIELTRAEYNSLRSQTGTLKRGEHVKYLPYVFTEQGVAMLSSVLNSKQAIAVNIQIIRVFSRIREMLITHKDILLKLEVIEKKLLQHDHHLKKHEEEIQMIFEALKQLLNTPNPPRRRIGYRQKEEKNIEI
jgi:ORF6N domain